MLNDFIRTFGVLFLIGFGVALLLLIVIAAKVLLIRRDRSKLEILANNIATLASDNREVRAYAYSMKCENITHAETIKRQEATIEELRGKIASLEAGMPVGPEGIKFECVQH